MTLPIERTRALRWGWEFLWELRSAGGLTIGQQQTVEKILAHYPTPTEISAWSRSNCSGTVQHLGAVDWLVPEPHDPNPPGGTSDAPNSLDRQNATPVQRMQALFKASEFMHKDLRGAPNLTAAQHRARILVCRHFPLPVELEAMALSEGLDPECVQSRDEFVRRGMAAIARSIALNDGVPANLVIAKLEAKLTSATKASRS